MPKIIGRALAALCAFMLFAAPAMAQVTQLRDEYGRPYMVPLGFDSVTGLSCVIGATPTCALNGAGGGGGGGGGSVTPYMPSGNASLAAGVSSSRVVLPSADTAVWVQNLGSATVYLKFGNSSVVATTSDTPLLAGQNALLNSAAATHLAGITASGTASLTITTGTGNPQAGLSLDNSAGVPTKGSIAEGSTAADPPVYGGGRATTAAPTARSDGQVVSSQFDKFGRLVTTPFNPRDLNGQSSLITLTGTTETTLVGAGGAGVFNDLTGIKLCNTSATDVRADIRDATAGTVMDSWNIKAGYCTGQSYTSPFKQTTANNNWTVQLSGAVTDVRVKAGYAANK